MVGIQTVARRSRSLERRAGGYFFIVFTIVKCVGGWKKPVTLVELQKGNMTSINDDHDVSHAREQRRLLRTIKCNI